MFTKDIENIIYNYLKPLKYFHELQNVIKNIKCDYIKYNFADYMSWAIIRYSGKWQRNNFFFTRDYRLEYLDLL